MTTSRSWCHSTRKRPGWCAPRAICCCWAIIPFSRSVASQRPSRLAQACLSRLRATCICSASMSRPRAAVGGSCANCTNASLMRNGLPGARVPPRTRAGRSASPASGSSQRHTRRPRRAANASGTPNKVMVGLISLGARALRTSRWSQERRVWARCARESGAGVTLGGASSDSTWISTRWWRSSCIHARR